MYTPDTWAASERSIAAPTAGTDWSWEAETVMEKYRPAVYGRFPDAGRWSLEAARPEPEAFHAPGGREGRLSGVRSVLFCPFYSISLPNNTLTTV